MHDDCISINSNNNGMEQTKQSTTNQYYQTHELETINERTRPDPNSPTRTEKLRQKWGGQDSRPKMQAAEMRPDMTLDKYVKVLAKQKSNKAFRKQGSL